LARQAQASTTPRSKWDEMAESRVFGPYVQVMRMHVVIIAFSALHAARRESFAAFVAIYGLYFFPWRLLRRSATADRAAEPVLAIAQESTRR
jgi:hypothetical protein